MKDWLNALHTLRFLRFRQIFWRLKYMIFPPHHASAERFFSRPLISVVPAYMPELPAQKAPGRNFFDILGINHDFGEKVDWNFSGNGRLWNYHLQYLDFLNDESLGVDERKALLLDIGFAIESGALRLEPYPVSLRLINTVLFACRHGKLQQEGIKMTLLRQTDFLFRYPEYHIDGNHLLVNAVALRLMSCCIQDPLLQSRSVAMLGDCLREQILPDGGHIERSLGYHAQLLKLLLILNGVVRDDAPDKALLRDVISRMAGYLKVFVEGSYFSPSFGDSPRLEKRFSDGLLSAAEAQGIQANVVVPSESGFRIFRRNKFQLIINHGDITPSWQPGHAHADMLSFEAAVDGKLVISDTGISTYESGERRATERSTAAHNTVCIGLRDQSAMWASFRVGRRARCLINGENEHMLDAVVDGYAGRNWRHRRTFRFGEDFWEIEDEVDAEIGVVRFASFHFDYEVSSKVHFTGNNSLKAGSLTISLQGASGAELVDYRQALGFNRLADSVCLRICFDKTLITRFDV